MNTGLSTLLNLVHFTVLLWSSYLSLSFQCSSKPTFTLESVMDTQTIIMNCPVRLPLVKYRSTALLCIFPSPSVCIADLPFYGDYCMKTEFNSLM